MKEGESVVFQGKEYVIHKIKRFTIVIRPKHSTITGECVEVTPDILQARKPLRFTELYEVNND